MQRRAVRDQHRYAAAGVAAAAAATFTIVAPEVRKAVTSFDRLQNWLTRPSIAPNLSELKKRVRFWIGEYSKFWISFASYTYILLRTSLNYSRIGQGSTFLFRQYFSHDSFLPTHLHVNNAHPFIL